MTKNWYIVADSDSSQVLFGTKQIENALYLETGVHPEITRNRENGNRIWLSVDPELPMDAYRVQITDLIDGCQTVMITGADETAVMYGCMDFVNVDVERFRLSHSSMNPYYFYTLFGDRPLPVTDVTRKPSVLRRGLWTWGMGIYDYRAYFEAMAHLKLNEVVIWNDYAPLNGRAVVDYAHSLGIKVLWGYAWGWDTQMVLNTGDDAVARIAEQYEREYAKLGADGIYFQSFTETTQERLEGRLIAEAVVDFVNRTAALLLEKHPSLRLQFGLHATSVKNHLEYIAQTDPRIEIIWEDCGDFPYHYIPSHILDQEGTSDFTKRIIGLRPDAAAGAVLKGMICLNWNEFRHETGPSVMGEADEETIRRRSIDTDRVWKYIQSEWMIHGDTCRKTVEELAKGRVSLYGLVEDGLIERGIPLPVALFSEFLWDCSRSFETVLPETARRPDVVMR